MVVCNSSMSISISQLRSYEYSDKVLSSAQLWIDVFVMKKYKSFRKMLKSKALKTDPCDTREISSKKLLYTLLIGTYCFLFLRYEQINENASLPNLQVSNLAIRRSWGMQSMSLERLSNTAPTILFLFSCVFHSSIKRIRIC